MGWAHKVFWTVTFIITSVFTTPLSSADAIGDLLHFVFAYNFRSLRVLSYCFCCVRCCMCMVHIKFTTRPVNHVVSSEVESMALDEALETSMQQREASTEATSLLSAESDNESWSGDLRDSEIASDNSGRLKGAVAAAAIGITYDFGLLGVTKARIGSMENYTHYFPKGYDQAPGVDSVPEPRANEAIVFEDFFTARLRMPPHPVLVNIMRKF
jgi:hypothetical protein